MNQNDKTAETAITGAKGVAVLKPLTDFHFNCGNSSTGPIGFCAVIKAESRAQAVERIRSILHDALDVTKHITDSETRDAIDLDYFEIYFNADAVTVNDIDDPRSAGGDELDAGFTIPAEVHTDDGIGKSAFDALRWFERASDKDILGLAEIEFGGGYAADAVALFMEDLDEGVAEVFSVHRAINRGISADPIGFECHVEREPALAWIKANRPELHATIASTI